MNKDNSYYVLETKEWLAFDNFMFLLRELKVISCEQYDSFSDRKFIKHLLADLKDLHESDY